MTVPEPTVCPRCTGLRWIGDDSNPEPCPACCCAICGETTDMPPVCLTCDAYDDSRQRRRADV